MAVFVEEVREADFDQNVVLFDVFVEFLFVFEDGVLEGDAVGADDVGVDDEVVFGVEVADGGLLVPDFVGIWGLLVEANDDGGKNDGDDTDDTDDSNDCLHGTPCAV